MTSTCSDARFSCQRVTTRSTAMSLWFFAKFDRIRIGLQDAGDFAFQTIEKAGDLRAAAVQDAVDAEVEFRRCLKLEGAPRLPGWWLSQIWNAQVLKVHLNEPRSLMWMPTVGVWQCWPATHWPL